jgi:hypothetical protein
MLPGLCTEVRALVGERRVTIVFDRGGWSPALFLELIATGFDILTYRKGATPRVPKKHFVEHTATFDGTQVRYTLADRGIALLHGKIRLRQVTRLSEGGHQTHIVTSRRDLRAVEVACRMFERWRQENFFKYLREEYALDALVDYRNEPDDARREVPNPKRAEVDAKLSAARQHDACLYMVVGMISHGNGFLKTFCFIIYTTWADGVYISVILLCLRMHQWVTINFRCRGH